jgi:hypothetical protein
MDGFTQVRSQLAQEHRARDIEHAAAMRRLRGSGCGHVPDAVASRRAGHRRLLRWLASSMVVRPGRPLSHDAEPASTAAR